MEIDTRFGHRMSTSAAYPGGPPPDASLPRSRSRRCCGPPLQRAGASIWAFPLMAVFGPNAPRSSGTSPPGLRRHLLESLLVVTAYFVVGKLGLLVPFTSGNISPVWPAAGIALTAVLLFGPPIAPAVFVGALLVNFFSPIPHGAAIGVAIGNTLGPLAGVALLRQIPGFTRRLPGLRDVVALVLCGGLLGTAL